MDPPSLNRQEPQPILPQLRARKGKESAIYRLLLSDGASINKPLPPYVAHPIRRDMDSVWPYVGDLHEVLAPPLAWAVLVVVSVVCGMVVGIERELRQKPAGLRTVMLICVGSTVFTLASILIGSGSMADRGRIAAQVVTGVGFLGAGAIIRERGTVVGLTTGATIWTAAAVGMIVGAGHAVSGLVLSLFIITMLTMVKWIQRLIARPCRYTHCRLIYNRGKGKTRLRALRILDKYHIPDSAWEVRADGDGEIMDIEYCHYHRNHRMFLTEIVDMPDLLEIQYERAARRDEVEAADES